MVGKSSIMSGLECSVNCGDLQQSWITRRQKCKRFGAFRGPKVATRSSRTTADKANISHLFWDDRRVQVCVFHVGTVVKKERKEQYEGGGDLG